MHIVVCLDEQDGILFNNRRLSSDKAVCQRVFSQCRGRLMMNSYSAKLFTGMDILVDDAFLRNAMASDTCFVENLDFVDFLSGVSSITIYRWNRKYPSDVKFPKALLDGWKLEEVADFCGNSHENITQERYIR